MQHLPDANKVATDVPFDSVTDFATTNAPDLRQTKTSHCKQLDSGADSIILSVVMISWALLSHNIIAMSNKTLHQLSAEAVFLGVDAFLECVHTVPHSMYSYGRALPSQSDPAHHIDDCSCLPTGAQALRIAWTQTVDPSSIASSSFLASSYSIDTACTLTQLYVVALDCLVAYVCCCT